MSDTTRGMDPLNPPWDESVNEEEAAALRRCLALYAPPPEGPGADQAFWERLQPQIVPRRPDPALCLPPLILAAGHTLWQGLWLVLGIFAAAGGWQALSKRLPTLLGSVPTDLWLVQALQRGAQWFRATVPSAWSGSVELIGWFAVGWAVLLGFALFYGAWMVLWLQPTRQESRILSGGI